MKFEDFRQCIAKTANLDLQLIQKETSIREELGIDSLQMVNLLVEISAIFNVELGQIQRNEDLQTVGNLYRLFGGDHDETYI